MKANDTTPSNIDEYIKGFPPAVQKNLEDIRATIRRVAPGAEEGISYRMPVFKLNGVLVYFAAFKKHIGLFPPVEGDARLVDAVSRYAGPKGNLQFPLDQRVPLELIERIVKFRLERNLAKTRVSRKK